MKKTWITFSALTVQEQQNLIRTASDRKIITFSPLTEQELSKAGYRPASEPVPEEIVPPERIFAPEPVPEISPEEILVIPETMSEIPPEAYKNNTRIRKLILHSKVRKIGNAAFYGCTSLESAEFPEGLEEIGSFAFWNCENLWQIILPASLVRIGSGAFYSFQKTAAQYRKIILKSPLVFCCYESICCRTLQCHKILNLNSSYFGDNHAGSLANAFGSGLAVTEELVIFNGEENIPDNAYRDIRCHRIVLPASVREIGHHAFQPAAPAKVVMHNSVREFYEDSFSGIPEIEVIDDSVQLTAVREKKELHKKYYSLLKRLDRRQAKAYAKKYRPGLLF